MSENTPCSVLPFWQCCNIEIVTEFSMNWQQVSATQSWFSLVLSQKIQFSPNTHNLPVFITNSKICWKSIYARDCVCIEHYTKFYLDKLILKKDYSFYSCDLKIRPFTVTQVGHIMFYHYIQFLSSGKKKSETDFTAIVLKKRSKTD